MKKHLLLFLVLPAILIFLILPALSQEDMMVIKDEGFQSRQRPPAVFRHDDHNEAAEIEECTECHHVYEDGVKLEDESSEDQLCSDCHNKDAAGNLPHLANAFHLNCKGCHQKSDKGPIMCGECHVR
ncbi:hypothetical protein D1AOALGA4SA_2411 [Olavius algarvensis Delta 1 endosymbiont]|nr:hypothetical protein D1AOALGA4SA_2411 [Olavius algarvensis Delta 1 endosymbiont]